MPLSARDHEGVHPHVQKPRHLLGIAASAKLSLSSVGRVWNLKNLLVPGQASIKNCPFSTGRRDLFLPTLGSWKGVTTYLAKMDYYRQILAHKVRSQLQPGYSGHLGRGKLPFFVGARGFEPRASWSQIIFRYLLWRKKGDSESGRVHTAHTVHGGAEKGAQICHTSSRVLSPPSVSNYTSQLRPAWGGACTGSVRSRTAGYTNQKRQTRELSFT